MLSALGVGESFFRWKKYLKQVVDFLIVNLQEGAEQLESALTVLVGFEKCVDRTGNDACEVDILVDFVEKCCLFLLGCGFLDEILPITAEHGIGLAWPCLSIGEDGHIEALEEPVDIGLEIRKNIPLIFLFPHYKIKLALDIVNLVMIYFQRFTLSNLYNF